MSLDEYKLGTTFPGVIGRTVDKSSPAWPKPLRAKYTKRPIYRF